MPWFKVDDNLAFHRKVVAAGNAAMGLWVRAGSWSAQQLTDGHVPDHMVAVIGTTAQAKRLIQAGLWDKVSGGYQFHEWAGEDRQPTRASVMAERAYNARRTALHRDPTLTDAVRKRDYNRCRYCGVLVAWTDRRSAAGGTYDHVDRRGANTLENLVVACRGCNSSNANESPTTKRRRLLPAGAQGSDPESAAGQATSYLEQNQNGSRTVLDQNKTPSRPDPYIEETPPAPPPGGARRRRPALPIPDNWRPTDAHREQAVQLHLDVRYEAGQFRGHALSVDRRQADWDQAFRNWLDKSANDRNRRGGLRAVAGGTPEEGFWEQ